VTPVALKAAAEPVVPTELVVLVTPVGPVMTVEPAAPAVAVAPVAPLLPVGPVEPAAPVLLVALTVPVGPVRLAAPALPVAPVAPLAVAVAHLAKGLVEPAPHAVLPDEVCKCTAHHCQTGSHVLSLWCSCESRIRLSVMQDRGNHRGTWRHICCSCCAPKAGNGIPLQNTIHFSAAIDFELSCTAFPKQPNHDNKNSIFE